MRYTCLNDGIGIYTNLCGEQRERDMSARGGQVYRDKDGNIKRDRERSVSVRDIDV